MQWRSMLGLLHGLDGKVRGARAWSVSGDLDVPEQPIERLAPKLSPTQPAPRRMSNHGDFD